MRNGRVFLLIALDISLSLAAATEGGKSTLPAGYRLDNKREYNPWTGKKRSEFNPWTGKRSGPEFNPWTGRRKRSIGAFYRSGAGKSEADSG